MAGEAWVVVLSREGRLKRMPLEAFGMQHRGGKGIAGAKPSKEDVIETLALVGAGQDLVVFTSSGRILAVPVDSVPEMSRYAQGSPVGTVFQLEAGEKLTLLVSRSKGGDAPYLAMATRKGVVKRTEMAPFMNVKAGGVRMITLDPGDTVCGCAPSGNGGELIIATRRGKAVRFGEDEARAMGRDAHGVTGIRLESGDEVVSLAAVDAGSMLLTLTAQGYGKRSRVEQYRKTARGTAGVTNVGDAAKVGEVVAAFPALAADQVIVASEHGMMVRVAAAEVRETGRSASGVRVMKINEGDRVTAVAIAGS